MNSGSAAGEAAESDEPTMTLSSDELKAALRAGSGGIEGEEPVEKTVRIPQEDAKSAEEASAAADEAAKPVEKTVPVPREKIATDGDSGGADKPEGRLLPWEPDAPAESSDASDKEMSDR